jgi:hypothetical protein
MPAYAGVERREPQTGWHVGKEIPLVLVCAVLLQTAGGIWWMAQLSSKIDAAVANISEFKTERYTREDARRDRELADQKLQSVQAVDQGLDRRLSGAETRIDRFESRDRDRKP